MRGSEFVPSGIDLLYCHLQRISLNRKGSSYIDSPKWLKNKKATINPKNNDNNCFQYALTVALNFENSKKTFEEYGKLIHLSIIWKEVDFPSEKKDWKKFELNNKSIAVNNLFVPYGTEKKIRLTYRSKHNLKRVIIK